MAKNENKYIKEFIDYYKNLGINKIILYDNNDIKDDNLKVILKKYINNNFIELNKL